MLAREASAEQRHRSEQVATEFFGQQAGVPGMGPEPTLWHEPVGAALAELLHPAFNIQEREFRVLPEQGWFSPGVNPRNPIEFQFGAVEVPKNQVLWLLDYQFQVFRPSGIDPGDFVVAAPGRFSNQIGFDINVRGRRTSNLSYQLDPQPVPQGRPEFERPTGGGGGAVGIGPGASDPFTASAARSFASTASPGTSLLPRRPNVMGPRGAPFTIVVGQEASVSLNGVIFNSLTAPIAAISARAAGWLLHTNLSSALLARVRPR